MNKPEKKDLKASYNEQSYERFRGYNLACDEWEAYHNWKMSQLPSEDEIREMLNKDVICHPPIETKEELMGYLAHEIAKRWEEMVR